MIPFFLSLKSKNELPITDPQMTRFMISLDDAVNLVWHAFKDMHGGEIYVNPFNENRGYRISHQP